jgi:hypothetical protein
MMRLSGRRDWQDHRCQNEKQQQDALVHFRLFSDKKHYRMILFAVCIAREPSLADPGLWHL